MDKTENLNRMKYEWKYHVVLIQVLKKTAVCGARQVSGEATVSVESRVGTALATLYAALSGSQLESLRLCLWMVSALGMGAVMEVKMFSRADHSERSEATLDEHDRVREVSVERIGKTRDTKRI